MRQQVTVASARAARAMRALDRLYETAPADARALDQYVADLRAECARYRLRAREAEAASAVQPRAP